MRTDKNLNWKNVLDCDINDVKLDTVTLISYFIWNNATQQ